MRITQFLFERCFLAVICAAVALSACGDQQGPQDPEEFYGETGHATADDPIAFTEQNYDFTGETPISDIHDLFDTNDTVWYGILGDDLYPQGDERRIDFACDDYGNRIEKVADEPAVIEGVVTLYPRYFQKVSVCGQDQRFYGAFFLQDETGGMLVLRDGRVTGYTFGKRVKLRVRAIMTSFGQPAVVVHDQEEVVDPDETYPIYFEAIDREFDSSDISEVRRIEGTVISEPTSSNFNELILEGDDDQVWAVSIDRELANRGGLGFEEGGRVQLTGPVINSYGLNMVIMSLGQIEHLDESD